MEKKLGTDDKMNNKKKSIFIGAHFPNNGQLPTGFSVTLEAKTPDPESNNESHAHAARASKPRKQPENSINELQSNYFDLMHSYIEGWPSLVSITGVAQSVLIEQHFNRFQSISSEEVLEDKDWKFVEVPESEHARALRSHKRVARKCESVTGFLDILLLGLVSQYDAFSGRLLRLCYEKQPNLVANSEKKFSAKNVLEFSDLEAFREAVFEKEVESFLRQSHEDQFSQLEKMFGVPLTKDLECWPDFIEAFERRNLLAHSRGVVSEQYLLKCKEAGLANPPKKGQTLSVSLKYLCHRIEVFAEIGIKLSQVISRKLEKSDANLEQNDRILNDIGYVCIEHGHWRLAKELLKFGISRPKHPNDVLLKMMVVNLANALKLLGDEQGCSDLLAKYPWSSHSTDFQISVAAIQGDVRQVIALMRNFHPRGFTPPTALRQWPVFKHVRDDPQFRDEYKRLFSEEFKPAFAIRSWEINFATD